MHTMPENEKDAGHGGLLLADHLGIHSRERERERRKGEGGCDVPPLSKDDQS
jgi:hypothetical protein